ncbi:hypothetical protein ABZ234_08165 [Nocardiopsis sp. NPDC006198]
MYIGGIKGYGGDTRHPLDEQRGRELAPGEGPEERLTALETKDA